MRRGRPPYPDILTPREQEVLLLIRDGLTNEQIAERLGISHRTARYHVAEILSKLGVSSRREAAVWAASGATKPWWRSVPGMLTLPKTLFGLVWRHASALLLAGAVTVLVVFALAVLASRNNAANHSPVVSTFAGGGDAAGDRSGYLDGTAGTALFHQPTGIAIDSAGNVYVADAGNHRLRRVAPNGMVSTIPGPSFMVVQPGGPPGAPQLRQEDFVDLFLTPQALAADRHGNVFLSGINEQVVYRIAADGHVEPIAGSARSVPRQAPFQDGPFADYKDLPLVGPAGDVFVRGSSGLAVDHSGNLYLVGDPMNILAGRNQMVRKLTPEGQVVLFAGAEEAGYRNGDGAEARFDRPVGVAVDRHGTVFVADQGNARVRRISPLGQVSTLAGSGEKGFRDGAAEQAMFRDLRAIATDATGNVYVLDSGAVRRISPDGRVRTLAGGGTGTSALQPGSEDGPGYLARFNRPAGLAVDDDGNVYVADWGNNRVRKMSFRPSADVPERAPGPGGPALVGNDEVVDVYVYTDSSSPAGLPCSALLADVVPASGWDRVQQEIASCKIDGLGLGMSYQFVQGSNALYLRGMSVRLITTAPRETLASYPPDTRCSGLQTILLPADHQPAADYVTIGCEVEPAVRGDPDIYPRVWATLESVAPGSVFERDVRCWDLGRYTVPRAQGMPQIVQCSLR
jgi:DNA-binding CsgD family transcriptional regulator/DNA-binding beta-propeller fold protein YncE